MKTDIEITEFISRLPKAELHVHHIGSASPQTVAELAALWGSITGGAVFVDQSAEDLGSGDPVRWERDDVRVVKGCPQTQSVPLVRPACVVVSCVFAEDDAQLPYVGNEHAVGALGPDKRSATMSIAVSRSICSHSAAWGRR